MNTLHEQFEELAGTAGPPSRLSSDEIYTAAKRRRRLYMSARLSGGLAVGLLTAGLGMTVLHHRPGTGPAQTASTTPPYGKVRAAVSTGAGHLYATVEVCTPQCVEQLLASDDNGKTWSVRQASGMGLVLAPASGVLMQHIETNNDKYDGTAAAGPKLHWTARISTDAGKTWRDVKPQTGKVAAVPSGGWAMCAVDLSMPTSGDGCTVTAVDPTSATASVLANQPSLDNSRQVIAPTSAGIWLTGQAHGDTQHPAVAVSHDQGKTWTVRTIGPDESGLTNGGMWAIAEVLTIDGNTAYAFVATPDTNASAGPTATADPGSVYRVYRTTDGGKNWNGVTVTRSLPKGAVQISQSYVASDGNPVILADENPPQQWYAGGNGGSAYAPVNLSGLGNDLSPSGGPTRVQIVAAGQYVAFDDAALFRSDDGLHWTQIVPRPAG